MTAQQRAKTMSDILDGAPFEYEPGDNVWIMAGRFAHQPGVIREIDSAERPLLPHLVQVGGDGPSVWLGADSIHPDLPLGPKYAARVSK